MTAVAGSLSAEKVAEALKALKGLPVGWPRGRLGRVPGGTKEQTPDLSP